MTRQQLDEAISKLADVNGEMMQNQEEATLL